MYIRQRTARSATQRVGKHTFDSHDTVRMNHRRRLTIPLCCIKHLPSPTEIMQPPPPSPTTIDRHSALCWCCSNKSYVFPLLPLPLVSFWFLQGVCMLCIRTAPSSLTYADREAFVWIEEMLWVSLRSLLQYHNIIKSRSPRSKVLWTQKHKTSLFF